MSTIISSSVILPAFQGLKHERPSFSPRTNGNLNSRLPTKHTNFTIQAAKLPAGVEMPKVEPKFKPPFLGFTYTAERWNSRACMMGLIGTFIVELILNKGILQLIGVEIGKGLDIPL